MSKVKGNRTERELLHMFWDNGFVCLRCAGSGSMPLPMPDLVAGKNNRILNIECKSGKDKRYLTNKEVDELVQFSTIMGAEAWIGARFDNNEWRFLRPNELGTSRSGTYFVDIKLAKEKGIIFEQLIKKE